MTVHKNKLNAGFTLIELLIVIAILGVLAVVVLVAINPVQQLARTRDAGRESGVTQMGHAIEAYAISHNGNYPVTATETWAELLVSSGEISIIPAKISYSASTNEDCQTEPENETWCYDEDMTADAGAIVFSHLESDSKQSLCTGLTPIAWFVYDTESGRGGVHCTADFGTEPAPTDGGLLFVEL